MVEHLVSRIEVASEQIDWAIRLLIDHQAYVSAITLAGAAEEIMGKIAPKNAFIAMTKGYSIVLGIDEKEIAKALNTTRNLLKHWDKEKPEEMRIDTEKEAISMIVRCIFNFAQFGKTIPSQATRFFEWQRACPEEREGWRRLPLRDQEP